MKIWVAVALSGVSSLAAIAPVHAQVVSYDIPAGDLKSALDAYARRSGTEIMSKADDVRGVRSRGARGAMSNDAALAAILAGTGFRAQREATGAIAIVKASAGPKDIADAEPIVVTGSRIRGATVSAPVFIITAEDARNSGQATLGEVARNLPQSFAGGQNPGVAEGVAGYQNRNVTASSTFNLRGLGSDATLTLLNGHRLAYDYSYQGVDISTIPLAAIDRVEVVADGASAIYGSDAVAGVANIILKRDFDGLASMVRVGASTDGGNTQQEYGLIGGRAWSDGGFMAIYNYQKNTPILSRHRDYTRATHDDQTLLPGLSQHSVIVAGHQRLSESIVFAADATYSSRSSETYGARSATLPPTQEGQGVTGGVEAWSISPKIEMAVSQDWRLTLSGTHARGKSETWGTYYAGGKAQTVNPVVYDNRTTVVELAGDGVLFQLNGNNVGLAAGAGYRSNSLDQTFGSITLVAPPTEKSFSGDNTSYYGFGEINLPVIAPENGAGIHRLSLTAALRFESYQGNDDILTPKLSGAFSPIEDITFMASWGRSFKAPTLTQLYNIPSAYLFDASYYGFEGAGTAIELQGANPELKNERATTWSATVVAEPRYVPGLRFEVSYFNIKYTNRVTIGPIANFTEAWNNPLYDNLIQYNPTPDQIASAVARAPLGLLQYASTPFDPDNVIGILDNRNLNLARQDLQGLDFQGSYEFETEGLGRFSLFGLVSYLDSRQITFPGQPEVQLAGTIFDPPNWRGRGSLSWSKDNVRLNAAVNYSGPLVDDRRGMRIELGSRTTFDFTAGVSTSEASGLFANMDFTLSALNMFNSKPRPIWTYGPQARPYESTNDSVVGRYIALTISKEW